MTLKDLNLVFDRYKPTPYNAEDLNRVGQAVQYVGGLLQTAGYFVGFTDSEVKTDWERGDFPTHAQLVKYLDNIHRLHDSLPTLDEIPLPIDIQLATYVDLNNIERLLSALETCIIDMQTIYQYSGDCVCGDAIVFPHLVLYDVKEVKRYLGQIYAGGLKYYGN